MYDEIIDEWQRQEGAVILAASLNIAQIAAHLTAQAEGYSLAIRSFDASKQDHTGAKAALVVLERSYCVLTNADSVLNRQELKTIAETVSVCIATLRRVIPKEEVPHEEAPSDTQQETYFHLLDRCR